VCWESNKNKRGRSRKKGKGKTNKKMGRLSAYAKNRILKLRFKKNKRIIHIVDILKKDDNIKVSRQAVSTFLKKYLETNSIYDKPRTGRKRKLTQEEIQLIGQVTRLNRDITARAIKEYLNLNVSTYTILRATKLFEWNKINPNSNDSKKAAALERQLNGEPITADELSGGEGGKKRRRNNSTNINGKKNKRKSTNTNTDTSVTEGAG
jgi:transposase